MEIIESPALTRVFPINATDDELVEYIDEQIDELKQQQICYDGMIRQRIKAKKEIEKLKKQKNSSVQRSLMEGLLGRPRGGLERKFKSKKKRQILKKKQKKKTKRKRK